MGAKQPTPLPPNHSHDANRPTSPPPPDPRHPARRTRRGIRVHDLLQGYRLAEIEDIEHLLRNGVPISGTVTGAHIQAAKDWPDAIELLAWAAEFEATVGEMRGYRRAKYGEDLCEPENHHA